MRSCSGLVSTDRAVRSPPASARACSSISAELLHAPSASRDTAARTGTRRARRVRGVTVVLSFGGGTRARAIHGGGRERRPRSGGGGVQHLRQEGGGALVVGGGWRP